jgi:hypothetical protein
LENNVILFYGTDHRLGVFGCHIHPGLGFAVPPVDLRSTLRGPEGQNDGMLLRPNRLLMLIVYPENNTFQLLSVEKRNN